MHSVRVQRPNPSQAQPKGVSLFAVMRCQLNKHILAVMLYQRHFSGHDTVQR